MSEKTLGQLSRILKSLRIHGLIKKVNKTYKYYLIALGKQIQTHMKIKAETLSPRSVNLLHFIIQNALAQAGLSTFIFTKKIRCLF
jgi:hypothetical protein